MLCVMTVTQITASETLKKVKVKCTLVQALRLCTRRGPMDGVEV
jgi:hypothetical protein